MNPGPWASHARYVALAAENIARATTTLDPETAYILGLAHDIGRREGPSDAKHIVDGFRFFSSRGFDDAARVCLTHSFQLQDVNTYFGRWDVPAEDQRFVAHFITTLEYDEYDRLIQLCDSLALPSGFCVLEQRFVDVALRYGTFDFSVAKWRATLELRAHFDRAVNGSVYALLPGIVENTFGFHIR